MSLETQRFSERLVEALRKADLRPSPTEVCRNFNARYHGNPVTIHAVRKWLVGEAIPVQDKLKVLADWLGVPPVWLRFGQDDEGYKRVYDELTSADVQFMSDFKALNHRDRRVVVEVVRSMIRNKGEAHAQANEAQR